MKLSLLALMAAAIPTVAPVEACPDAPAFDTGSGETAKAESEPFIKHCPPLVLERFFPPDAHPAVVGFFHSAKWGDIARVDVGYPGNSGRMRFVCFKSDQGSKVRWVTYDVETKACSTPEQHPGYWTIYPPLSGQSEARPK